jgi:FKBP-type peptidyl-prolyl cis-trans isomerase SlyD
MGTRVISFHYTLKDNTGQVLDSSQGAEPMTFMEGSQQIIPGLEKVVITLNVGDKQNIPVKAEEAYGQYDQALVMEIPRTQFPPGEQIETGMQFGTQSEDGVPLIFTVKKVGDASVTVDGNHPLAGVDLFFDVEVTDIRPATLDEIKHGHAHGPGGHHH